LDAVVDPTMATVAAPHRGSEGRTGNQRSTQPFVARTIRRLSVPIILAWLAVGVIATVGVPSLEKVEKQHSVSLIPTDAPAFRAMERMNVDFRESDSFSVVMIVLDALSLIFIVMLILTRSVVAALVIVGTVAFSLAASFGLSVLVWQYLLGTQIHWAVLAMSVIVLLAVGSDYNLLLVSRMKEEVGAGINTASIPASFARWPVPARS
jgi:uncharacterized membrane protein YdfJ with MMPL/SSD domain